MKELDSVMIVWLSLAAFILVRGNLGYSSWSPLLVPYIDNQTAEKDE